MQEEISRQDAGARPVPEGFVPYPPISPFMAMMGPMHSRQEADGGFTVGLHVLPHHLNHQGIMHGGMVATLADNAMGFHVSSSRGHPIATVHLSVDYLARVPEAAWLEVRSRIDRAGARLIFASCEGWVGEDLAFRCNAVFSAVRPRGA